MDFQNILSIAAQNSSSKQVKKVFSTQLAPPKKEKKDKEIKSEVVKKLLEEKEREKREAVEARERIKRKIEEAKERKKREKELKLRREKEEEERRRKEEEKKNRFKIPRKGESTTDKNEIKSSTSSSSSSASVSSKAKTASGVGKNAVLKTSDSKKSDAVTKKHKSNTKVKNHLDKVSYKLKNSSGNSENEKIDPTTVKPTAISSQQRSSHLYDGIEKKSVKNETEIERKRREFEEKRARLLQQIKNKGVESEKPVVVKKTEKTKSGKDSDKKSEKKNKSEKQLEQEKVLDKLNNKPSSTSGRQDMSKPSVSEKIKAHNSGKKMPPPMGFSDLLKLAQVKASEPVTVESMKKVDKPSRKETDRLMTKEERERYMEEQAYKQRKSLSLMGKGQSSSGDVNDKSSSSKRENNDRNSKHSKEKIIRDSREDRSSPKLKNLLTNGVKSGSPETTKMNSTLKRKSEAYSNSKPSSQMISKSSSSSALHRPHDNSDAKKRRLDSPSMSKATTSSPSIGRPNGQSSYKPAVKRRAYDSENENVLVCGPPKQKPEAALNPFDRIYGQIKKNHPKPEMKKRRIESDEEDSEYDEEMEGFITDEGSDLEEDYPQDMDYSKHIRQIFGYDRRKYKYESDRDIANMESNFAQQMKEEARSARLGLQEDLEDIRREEEELKRKMEKKKR